MHVQKMKFHESCDILVVGGGNAGLTAALQASDICAKVILIEKGPKPTRGGNSQFTYGHFRVITRGTHDIRALLDAAALLAQPIEIEALPAEFFFGEAVRLSEGLADATLTRLRAAIANMLASPDIVARLATLGYKPEYLSGDQFKAFVVEDLARRRQVANDANIVLE